MKRLLLMAMTVLLLCVGPTCAGPLEDGLAAYERGDYAKALRIFRPLAKQGDAVAKNNLGVMYDSGQGVAQDQAEAVKWYRLAAAQGNAEAQYNLGLRYAKGLGVLQDYVRAHMWLNLAAVSGDADAVKFRDIVATLMTPQQIAQAQQMASDCQRRNFKGCD